MANVKRLMFCEFECVFFFCKNFEHQEKKNIHLLSFLKMHRDFKK